MAICIRPRCVRSRSFEYCVYTALQKPTAGSATGEEWWLDSPLCAYDCRVSVMAVGPKYTVKKLIQIRTKLKTKHRYKWRIWVRWTKYCCRCQRRCCFIHLGLDFCGVFDYFSYSLCSHATWQWKTFCHAHEPILYQPICGMIKSIHYIHASSFILKCTHIDNEISRIGMWTLV